MAQPASQRTATAAATEGRSRFAATIVAGHALKHTLTAGLFAALIPEIKLALSLSATQVGALGTVQQFTGWAATMGAGYLGDRFTTKTGLMLGLSLGLTGAALLILGFADSYLTLTAGMLLMGLGPSMFHPPAIGALSRRFADRRSFAISLHGAGGSVGEVLGPLIGAGLLALLVWRDVLRVEFVVAAVAAFFMWRLLRQTNGADSDSPVTLRAYFASFLGLLRQHVLRIIFLVTALRAIGQASTSVFLPIYLREDLGYSVGLVGLYISLSQLAGIVSQPVMGHLADRFSHKAVILPALLMFAVCLGLIPLAEGKLQLAVVILGLGFFVFSMQSILTSAAVEQAGEEMQSTVVSLIYGASFVGSLSPTIAGILADTYGLRSTFVFSFAVTLLAAAVVAFAKLPQRRPAAS